MKVAAWPFLGERMARMKNWLLGVFACLMLVSAVPAAHAQVIVINRHHRHYYHHHHYYFCNY